MHKNKPLSSYMKTDLHGAEFKSDLEGKSKRGRTPTTPQLKTLPTMVKCGVCTRLRWN